MADEEANPEYGKITEEAVAKMKNRLGKTYPINEPFVRYANIDSVTHVARAIGDDNPLFINPEYAKKSRYGKIIAPPAFFYAVAWGSWDLRHGQGLPGVHGLHSGDSWKFLKPVFDGDEIHATKTLVRIDPMEGRMAGNKTMIQADEIRFYNQRDELVAVQIMPIIRVEREESKKRGKNSGRQKMRYTSEEIAQIDREMGDEHPRGATPRFWEDVNVGDALNPVVKGPLTLPDMVAWLLGIGSPHVRTGKYWLKYRQNSPKVAIVDPASGIPQAVERVHWDDWMAAEIGMPAAYDYGSQRGGYATYFATNWVGDDGWVAEMDFRYRGMVFNGDTFRITGEITDKWRGAKTGTGYVKGKFTSINNLGEDVMPGTVTFALPSKEGGPIEFPVNVDEDGRA